VRPKLLVILVAVPLMAVVGLGLERLVGQVVPQLVFLILVLCCVMLLSMALRPEPVVSPLCDPVVLFNVFNAQFYVVGPVAMATWGLSDIAFFRPPETTAAIPPLLGCIFMTAAFVMGQTFSVGTVLAARLPRFPATPRQLPRRGAAWLLALAGVGGCIAWIQYEGGLLARLNQAYGVGREGGAMFALAYAAILVATLLAAWEIADSPAPRRSDRVLFYGLLAFEIPFFGLIQGARKYLIFLSFGLLTLWLLRRGARSIPKRRVAAGAALLLVFFSVWGTIRGKPLAMLVGAQSDVSHRQKSGYQEGYLSGLADPFGVACMVWQIFPEQEPFRYGSTTLVVVLGFIPRAIWPDKPVGIGKDLTRYYVGPLYQPFSGFSVTPTLPGEVFINFGWLGVVLGGLLYGIVCRVVVSYAAHGMQDGVQREASRVLLPAVFVMNLGEIRADTAQVMANNVMTMVPLLAALVLFRLNGQPSATPPAP
jgi:hypothetical protein